MSFAGRETDEPFTVGIVLFRMDFGRVKESVLYRENAGRMYCSVNNLESTICPYLNHLNVHHYEDLSVSSAVQHLRVNGL
jgi:hypothetical protein